MFLYFKLFGKAYKNFFLNLLVEVPFDVEFCFFKSFISSVSRLVFHTFLGMLNQINLDYLYRIFQAIEQVVISNICKVMAFQSWVLFDENCCENAIEVLINCTGISVRKPAIAWFVTGCEVKLNSYTSYHEHVFLDLCIVGTDFV